MADNLRFFVLRQVGIERDGVPLVLARKPRALLAVLLLRAGRPVSVAQLAERVWGEDLPVDERGALQTYVNRLRAALGEDGAIVQSRAGGYLIEAGPDQLDLAEFEDLVAKADRVAEQDPRAEADLLQQAIALWGDDPLGDTGSEALERLELPALVERRLSVVERRIDAELRVGLDAQLVPELRALTADHPLRERLWAQLMLALHRSGRRAAALSAYDAARRQLVDDLGIEPGKELRDLQQAILAGSESLDAPDLPEPQPAWPVHRQLPLEVADFTGREQLVSRVEKLLTDPDLGIPIVALSGPPGAGKSALAIRVGHRLRSAFPDGQWYVGLAGAGEHPRDPYAVLAELLVNTGLATTAVPDGLDARAALLRSRLADRQVLIVLDDAGKADQVRPLLPGSAGSAVLITSRNSLAGLIALAGGQSVPLDQLAPDESAALVAALLGSTVLDRSEAEELARLCGHLPLALRIAASNLAARPGTDPARYLADLRSGNRLSKLAVFGDPQAAVRNAFEQSYRSLDAETSRLFRLLGVVPGPDFNGDAAAVLLDRPVDEAEAVLGALAAANLVQEHQPGRFQFHDLLRLYAEEHGAADPERSAALDRLLVDYLIRLNAASQAIAPRKIRLPSLPVVADAGLAELTPAEARTWLAAEQVNLVAAVSARAGRPEYTWHLADLLRGPLEADGHIADWREVVTTGLEVALEAGDPRATGSMYRSRGSLYASLGRLEDSEADLLEAARWFRRIGDRTGEISALNSLGISTAFMGRVSVAYDYCRQAYEAAKEAGLQHQTAMTLGNLAAILHQLGRPRESLAAATEARQLQADLGVGPGESSTLHTMAVAQQSLGLLDEALAAMTIELEAVERLGDPRDVAQSLEALATIHRDRGEFEAAEAAALQGVALAIEVQDPMTEAHLRTTLGDALVELARYAEAADSYHAGLVLARQTKSAEVEVRASVGLSQLELVAGDPAAAVEHAERAVAVFETLEMRILEGTARSQLAAARHAAGNLAEARTEAEQAITLHEEAGAPIHTARSHQILARISRSAS
ncbi:DNA-binding SARP family transcriptional activator [Kribbella amoyensis]|uniref:DNA-binding SARP family transcriptional activator n=1 Tax=Kribbella amoyensis TaxID=996641 RepID=A0A561BJI3_9ACTN|nr:AfsR/SARP family transcriptional regulator [Kribbella amoyensis]TWD79023.1 DNA-binding SARP family transcriptional activator [Kribbella amoyensis]